MDLKIGDTVRYRDGRIGKIVPYGGDPERVTFTKIMLNRATGETHDLLYLAVEFSDGTFSCRASLLEKVETDQ